MFLYYIYIYTVYVCGLLSHVWLFATPWTIASQTPLTMGFPRQEYWSGLPFSSSSSCRKGDPFQAQEWALVSHSDMSCPRRHMCWESRRLCWERAPGWRAGGSGSPGGQLCRVARSLGVYGDGMSLRVFSDQSFWLRVLPGGARVAQPRWAERILGGSGTCGVTVWPFPNSSGWWCLISSMFLTRTSCRETTCADGYCGAWPGWAVSAVCFPEHRESFQPRDRIHVSCIGRPILYLVSHQGSHIYIYTHMHIKIHYLSSLFIF